MNNVYLIRPDPCDAAWAAMVGTRTPLQAARYFAHWLHVRSPPGVSSWTHEQLRAHYGPVIRELRPLTERHFRRHHVGPYSETGATPTPIR